MALTSRNTMTAPVTTPSRSWMGATESSMNTSCPSRRIRTLFKGKFPIRFCDAAFAIGSRMALRVTISTIRTHSVITFPTASFIDHPVMLSATRFRNVILPDSSVQTTASPMHSSVTWARSFSTNWSSSIFFRSAELRRARVSTRGSIWLLIR